MNNVDVPALSLNHHYLETIDPQVIWNKIPSDVKKLLFISLDENPEDFENGSSISIAIDILTGKIQVNTLNDDPSTIFFKCPLAIPKDITGVDKISYYPAYAELQPEQRYLYLNWLTDISQKVDTGYVFLFYYGLERHLLLGQFEAAFDMILKLRLHVKNKSFQSYSRTALVFSTILKRKVDFFGKLTILYNDEIWGDEQLFIKLYKKEPLSPVEIIKVLRGIPTINKRYIKNELELYTENLKQLLIERYGSPELFLSISDIKCLTQKKRTIFANISFPVDVSCCKVPTFLGDKKYIEFISELHNTCHNRVKEYLKLRKK
jgi:hypothetical protein